ncbi:PepSY-associated TM helix domain-containing protein [Novosphingobium terrae]|uniref:PepSY-associated TM helix domain-containing protein n=1 Tax=Novosphingobium terrae TaxID=2726189 RepID=UPI00197FA2D5|nr:PepSY-associated TM helix domain-containing protein [Novosphingobium terrae]
MSTVVKQKPVLTPAERDRLAKRKKAKQFWLKQLHSWHWISAALSMVGMLAFAITGITLNHAEAIHTEPKVVSRSGQLPAAMIKELAAPAKPNAPLPADVAAQVKAQVGIDVAGRPAEWASDIVTVNMPRPGGDGWVTVDPASGAIASEVTDRGWLSLVNDLHKGRNSGGAWSWFIDLFAAACVIFTLTGLLLLQLHSKHRPSTWPIVGLGLLIPILLIHFLVP